MAKNNIRSIRYSDAVKDIIEAAPGDSWNEKFDRLVYKCYHLVPEKEAEIKRLDERIAEKKKILRHLSDRAGELAQAQNRLAGQMNNYETALNLAIKELNKQ